MEGKINKQGILVIERAGILSRMKCRGGGHYGGADKFDFCKDACAKFGEPTVNPGTGKTDLTICENKTWSFDTFTDER